MGAPVCHDSRDQVITQPTRNQQPAIPHATDLASALAAIAALKKVVEGLTIIYNTNNFQNPGQQKNQKPAPKGRWTQLKRSTEKVKVTNPSDPTQFVEIERINSLTMVDKVTGETWVWTR